MCPKYCKYTIAKHVHAHVLQRSYLGVTKTSLRPIVLFLHSLRPRHKLCTRPSGRPTPTLRHLSTGTTHPSERPLSWKIRQQLQVLIHKLGWPLWVTCARRPRTTCTSARKLRHVCLLHVVYTLFERCQPCSQYTRHPTMLPVR